ncbi:LOW QUALITY PROTEIN: trypsin alpha-3-like [Atheta coriaria]|uniref:LOW QUALITY PROTEIN: trypsin alpha-3-like n=1 Tax=Dalotia coriaria TaxID=877792 RepID=UPI0031F47143
MKTIQLTILFCAIFSVYCKPVEVDDDDSQEGKIVGGYEILFDQASYQAAMFIYGSFACGGSVLNRNTIITAVHCTDGIQASTITIRAGSADRSSGGQLLSVTRIIQHADYNRRTVDNDIALLKVDQAITTATPVQWPNSEPRDNTVVRDTGWGHTTEGGSTARNLRAVEVNMVTNRATCLKNYGDSTITRNLICAASNGKDSCQGDSGGPLMLGNTQVGVVSWGGGCAQPDNPGVGIHQSCQY